MLLPSLLVRTIIPRGSITITSSSSSYVGDVRRIFTVKPKERDLFDSLPSNRLQCKRCATVVLQRRRRRLRRYRKLLNVTDSTNTNNNNNRKKSDALK